MRVVVLPHDGRGFSAEIFHLLVALVVSRFCFCDQPNELTRRDGQQARIFNYVTILCYYDAVARAIYHTRATGAYNKSPCIINRQPKPGRVGESLSCK